MWILRNISYNYVKLFYFWFFALSNNLEFWSPVNRVTTAKASYFTRICMKRTQVYLRSMGPDVCLSVCNWVETWLMWLWRMKVPTDEVNRAIYNQCKWYHMVAKFTTSASVDTWPNLIKMQVPLAKWQTCLPNLQSMRYYSESIVCFCFVFSCHLTAQ